MKAARLQVLTTPVFRDWLRKEAWNTGVSVAELVRTRCERKPTGERNRPWPSWPRTFTRKSAKRKRP
jgi:hypothetical protein